MTLLRAVRRSKDQACFTPDESRSLCRHTLQVILRALERCLPPPYIRLISCSDTGLCPHGRAALRARLEETVHGTIEPLPYLQERLPISPNLAPSQPISAALGHLARSPHPQEREQRHAVRAVLELVVEAMGPGRDFDSALLRPRTWCTATPCTFH